jgi:perosamine synthetase
VHEVLQSDWLTTGPTIEQFERRFADDCGAAHAVAVSSGTAALHACMFAVGVGAGDEVIVPAMTFASTANCVVFQGGTPVFCDVEPDTLLIALESVEEKITSRTKVIIAVDYAGQPCDYDALQKLAEQRGVRLVADACHAVGGSYKGRPVGSLAELSAFSFHPVKLMTTGEGGMVTADDGTMAQQMRAFRNHGIDVDHHRRAVQDTYYYEMAFLGYNYRMTDMQAALGLSQLRKLRGWVERRRQIAERYDAAIAEIQGVEPLDRAHGCEHAYHLYVVKVDTQQLGVERSSVFSALRSAGVGANVHFLPVYLHPFYRKRFGLGPGLCPGAEMAYERILSLPIFPDMTDSDVDYVIAKLRLAVGCSSA